jgi:hypothetical protein
MFDNLREISDGSDEFDEPIESIFEQDFEEAGVGDGRIMGMTAGQRFFISLMLLATVIVLGITCLMVTEKVWPF